MFSLSSSFSASQKKERNEEIESESEKFSVSWKTPHKQAKI